MSINHNRTRGKNLTTRKEYRFRVVLNNEPYYDEGCGSYPKWRPGFKNTGKQLYRFQQRNFRSWKHNRKTQYKL